MYRQFLPRRVNDTEIKEPEKCECVSSVITIAPVLKIEIEKIGTLGILTRIGDGVYVCNCTVYSYVSKQFTQHSFVYENHFSTREKSACCGGIIYNRLYGPTYELKEKYRESKHILENILRDFFEGTCIMKYAFKNTSHEYP